MVFQGFALTSNIQKQPSIDVLTKRCSENMQQIYRRTPMPKFDFKKVSWKHLLKTASVLLSYSLDIQDSSKTPLLFLRVTSLETGRKVLELWNGRFITFGFAAFLWNTPSDVRLCFRSLFKKVCLILNYSWNAIKGENMFTVRSSCLEVFCIKGVLRNFAKFTGKHLFQSYFFCKFVRKEVLTQAFSCKFCEIYKDTFLHRTPAVAASEADYVLFLLSFSNFLLSDSIISSFWKRLTSAGYGVDI